MTRTDAFAHTPFPQSVAYCSISSKTWRCRKFAVFLRRFPSIRTDVVGLLDEWAARFFEELDYVREGNNGIIFAKQMAKDLPQVSASS